MKDDTPRRELGGNENMRNPQCNFAVYKIDLKLYICKREESCQFKEQYNMGNVYCGLQFELGTTIEHRNKRDITEFAGLSTCMGIEEVEE